MAPSIKINVQFVDEPSPANRARVEFYTHQRRLQFGKFLFAEIQKATAEKAKKHIAD